MKHREPRRKVMIQARMRAGACWTDACILNLSSRGMLIRADKSPSRGSYLEIRRGFYVIIARVVWTNSERFGVQTQDVVPADDLISQPDRASVKTGSASCQFVERRAITRSSDPQLDASRSRGRAMEFCLFLCLGGIAAIMALGAVEGVLAKPLEMVETALKTS